MLLLLGGLTGLMLSAPIGAVNILCLEKTLKSGVKSGFITGSGAAFGDFLFVVFALIGGIALSDIQQNDYLYLMKYIGAFVLFIFCIGAILKAHSQYNHIDAHQTISFLYNPKEIKQKKNRHFLNFMATFFLTITNPLTPIGVVSMITAIGLGGGIFEKSSLITNVFFASGIIIGSLGWWYSLANFAYVFSTKITGKALSYINYVGAFVMGLTALYLILYI